MELGGNVSILAVKKMIEFDDVRKELNHLLQLLDWCLEDLPKSFMSFDSSSNDYYVNEYLNIWISRNNYDDFFRVEDYFFGVENLNDRLRKAKYTDERYIISFRSNNEYISKLCLLLSVAISNLVDGVVDLTAMVCDVKFNNKVVYDRNEWKTLVFKLIKNK